MSSSALSRLCRIFPKKTPSSSQPPSPSRPPPPPPPPTNPPPPFLSHKTLVDNVFNERDLTKLVQNFKKLSEIPGFRNRHRIYKNTVLRLASAKKFESIQEVLEHQKKYECITKEGFAVRLISLYGKVGMFDSAFKTFDEMPQLKCQRSVMSFNALLKACVHSKQFEKADKLFRELPVSLEITPDVRSYNIVIQALCEMGSLDSAYLMLDEMESNGMEPNLITFNILVHGFCSDGRFEDGERIWARMEDKGIVPDLVSFNGKLDGLVNGGKLSEAVKLLEELKTRELKPNIITYNVLIEWYCRNENLDEAKGIYDCLLKNDCVPNRKTFQALIPCIYEKGDLDLALKLCMETVNTNCFIDVGLLQVVVDGLVKELRVEEAEELVKLARLKLYRRSTLKMPSKDE